MTVDTLIFHYPASPAALVASQHTVDMAVLVVLVVVAGAVIALTVARVTK